ncbi:MAG: hypothetical protein ABWW66_04885 [Archaeoglobaceae archaeon]
MKEIVEIERFLGLSLIIFGTFLILAGIIVYLLPQLEKAKITEIVENPLIILPIKRDGFLIGFSPLIFLILLIAYLIFYLRS